MIELALGKRAPSPLTSTTTVLVSLEHWHNITCLNFQRKDDEPKGNRIVFTDVDGCASNVGKHPLGEPQFVSLAPECIRVSFDFKMYRFRRIFSSA